MYHAAEIAETAVVLRISRWNHRLISSFHEPSFVEDASGVFVTAIVVGFVQAEAPRRVEGVHLKLFVVVARHVWVEKHLKVLVLGKKMLQQELSRSRNIER